MALNVKLIRLLNGEELMAEVVSSNDSKVTIKDAIRVVVMPQRDPKASPSIGFAPWLEFSEDKQVELDKSHVLFVVTPIKEFVNQYNSLFGGIVTPTTKLILPS